MPTDHSIPVPKELKYALKDVLEEYVKVRILQFARAFARKINPGMASEQVSELALQTLSSLEPLQDSNSAQPDRELAFVFRHDCRSLGCNNAGCELCAHNPSRQCTSTFARKYLVGDSLKPKCDATIWVSLVDQRTGKTVTDDIPDMTLEAAIIDGVAYSEHTTGEAEITDADIINQTVLLNKEGTHLLVARNGSSPSGSTSGMVTFVMKNGVAKLPDIFLTASSEALLPGRKPPFRLWVRAVDSEAVQLKLTGAVSEPFVVATKRVKIASKVDTPSVNDDISKIKNLGRETVRKLRTISESAATANLDIPPLPMNCVSKVGDFQELARLCENDAQLSRSMQQLLKMSKQKWQEACEHSRLAVKPDNRIRIWYKNTQTMDEGLLFGCRMGTVDLDRPLGLLQKSSHQHPGELQATMATQQTPAQRELVAQLKEQARQAWWTAGHPGWATYPADSETLVQTGVLAPSRDAFDGDDMSHAHSKYFAPKAEEESESQHVDTGPSMSAAASKAMAENHQDFQTCYSSAERHHLTQQHQLTQQLSQQLSQQHQMSMNMGAMGRYAHSHAPLLGHPLFHARASEQLHSPRLNPVCHSPQTVASELSHTASAKDGMGVMIPDMNANGLPVASGEFCNESLSLSDLFGPGSSFLNGINVPDESSIMRYISMQGAAMQGPVQPTARPPPPMFGPVAGFKRPRID